MSTATKPVVPGAAMLDEETAAKFRAQLAAVDASPEAKALEANLGGAMEERAEKDKRDLLGLDLDFDPKAFITKGVIAKKGIPVGADHFVDMHSLTTRERMLADSLVREKFGVMRMDNVYLTAIEAAVVAVSVTRINNASFENPDLMKSMADPANKPLFDAKMALFEMLLDSTNERVSMLTVVYQNLEAVKVPTEEVQKKS